MKKSIIVFVLLLFSMFFAVGGAGAAILDFGVVAPTAGTISYTTAGGALSGLGIEVDNVVGLATPLNSGIQYAITGGLLNFTTGNLASYSSSGPINTWLFNGGGSITLSALAVPGIVAGPANLFTGTFNYAMVTGNGSIFNVVVSEFTDEKNADLAAFFGLGSTGYIGNMNISFTIGQGKLDTVNHTFTSELVLSGDVTNTVPVPASLLLLGSGLVGLVGLGRKKFFSKS